MLKSTPAMTTRCCSCMNTQTERNARTAADRLGRNASTTMTARKTIANGWTLVVPNVP